MEFLSHHDPLWHRLSGEDGPQPHPAPRPHALLTLEQWHAVRDHWPADLSTGVLLPNTADVAQLAADLPRLALLVLQFPKWTDGRAYSQARLLRGRHRFSGEVRATGDVLVDMVPLLQRAGFSSVQLRGDQKVDSARRQLQMFDAYYQVDVLDPRPWFKRHAA